MDGKNPWHVLTVLCAVGCNGAEQEEHFLNNPLIAGAQASGEECPHAERPHGHFPSLRSLLCASGLKPFFVKLDVTNFFWSLHIPPTVTGYFVYQSSEKSFVFGSRRLPFGWFFSPILGQKTLERILLPLAAWFPDLMWQFIDDILLGHPDPYFLSFACAFAVCLLEKSGLLMSPKSQLVHSTHITWLGKDISCKLLCNSYKLFFCYSTTYNGPCPRLVL